MCLWASNMKKYEKKIFFLASLKSKKKGVGSGVGSGSGSIGQRYGSGSPTMILVVVFTIWNTRCCPSRRVDWCLSKKKSIFWPTNIGAIRLRVDVSMLAGFSGVFLCLQGVKNKMHLNRRRKRTKNHVLEKCTKKGGHFSMIMMMFTLLWSWPLFFSISG